MRHLKAATSYSGCFGYAIDRYHDGVSRKKVTGKHITIVHGCLDVPEVINIAHHGFRWWWNHFHRIELSAELILQQESDQPMGSRPSDHVGEVVSRAKLTAESCHIALIQAHEILAQPR